MSDRLCIYLYSCPIHATAGDDRELYEGVPDVDSGCGCQNQSTVTAPPPHPGHAKTLHHQKGKFKHFTTKKVGLNT